MTTPELPWGRLLIAGGTDFATLGRKQAGKSLTHEDRPDLASFHILRPVANIKFKRIIASHSGCHQVAIDVNNKAYLFGRNEHHQLSHPLPPSYTVSHLSTDGTSSPTPAAPFPFPLVNLPDANAPPALKEQGIVEAGVGRSHTILVTENGEAWSAGQNSLGQCGHSGQEHVSSFTRIKGALMHEKVIAATAGLTFSLFLTESGKVYAVGSGEKGQLGNGKTGEHIAASKVFFDEHPDPVLVRGILENKKIVQISSGQQHSVALDDQGYVYSWGFGGLGRLGLGAQYDALSPTVVPNFAGPNVLTRCKQIAAGSTNTLFIDAQGMVSLCGKWKTTGDGSAGQPWMSPKLVQDIMGYKWQHISAGGVSLFCSTYDAKEGGDFVVCWGQGAVHGELGLGAGSVKSATKPTRIDALDGITMLDIACGQNTTFLLARPPPTVSATKAVAAAIEAAASVVVAESSSEPAAPAGDSASSKGIDLSGFGFDFGAPAPPKPKVEEKKSKAVDVGEGLLSRTEQKQWEELVRFPPVLDGVDQCQVCGNEEGEEEPLECEMCEQAFHGSCLSPPIEGVPDGEWFCPSCSDDPLPPAAAPQEAANKKRKAPAASAAKGKKKKA